MSAKTKKCLIAIAIYLIAVITCIYLAFDFEGSIDTTWTLILFIITLPWSMVSIMFAWALIHGAGLEMFVVMFMAFAIINSLLIYMIFGREKPPEMP
ncbi:MAG TPA: hypothetical protein VGB00_01170 [Pyrinomonadaceae bacterium]